jgi:ABC-type lipoprotein export system ATPase subunit
MNAFLILNLRLMIGLGWGGTTIIQVTHDPNWAAYGHRIIELRDGWMEK